MRVELSKRRFSPLVGVALVVALAGCTAGTNFGAKSPASSDADSAEATGASSSKPVTPGTANGSETAVSGNSAGSTEAATAGATVPSTGTTTTAASGPGTNGVLGVACTTPTPATLAEVNSALNVTYATLGGQNLQLDIVYPKKAGPHPLVVMVHGGGFTSGDKTDEQGAMLLLVTQGYAVASIDYRLALNAQTEFPAQMQDLRCSIRFLRSKAALYDIDPTRIAAVGDSAGATLTALLGTTTDATTAFDSPDCPVAPSAEPASVLGVVDDAGRADLHTDPADNPAVAVPSIIAWLGLTPPEAEIELASPLTHVSSSSVPFLLIHGLEDPRVLSSQNIRLAAALTAAQVPNYLMDHAGWAHDPPIFSTNPLYHDGLCAGLNFLAKYLAP